MHKHAAGEAQPLGRGEAHIFPENYHDMSEDDRVAHWVGCIYRGMRWAGEIGHDEISILDSRELDRWKELDPTVERLMPRVLEVLAGMWLEPKDTFFQRINEQMGTQFSRPSNKQFDSRRKEILKSPSIGSTCSEEIKKNWWKF